MSFTYFGFSETETGADGELGRRLGPRAGLSGVGGEPEGSRFDSDLITGSEMLGLGPEFGGGWPELDVLTTGSFCLVSVRCDCLDQRLDGRLTGLAVFCFRSRL